MLGQERSQECLLSDRGWSTCEDTLVLLKKKQRNRKSAFAQSLYFIRWCRFEHQNIFFNSAVFLENDKFIFDHFSTVFSKTADFFSTVFKKQQNFFPLFWKSDIIKRYTFPLSFLSKLVVCPPLPLPRVHSLFEFDGEVVHWQGILYSMKVPVTGNDGIFLLFFGKRQNFFLKICRFPEKQRIFSILPFTPAPS